MTISELTKLIKQGESQTVSLKALKTKPSTLARPMASFSNTNDGVIIIGVDDKTRKISGAKTTQEREEGLDNIHNAAKQCCQPNVDVSKIEEIKTTNGIVFIVPIIKNPDEVYVLATYAKKELKGLQERNIFKRFGRGKNIYYKLVSE